MKKKSSFPQTKVKNPEPKKKDENWVIWAAWADRITFEEIKEKSGKNESEVIKIMRKNLKPGYWKKQIYLCHFSNRFCIIQRKSYQMAKCFCQSHFVCYQQKMLHQLSHL